MSKKGYLFTSESVSEGHPDKISDQVSDAILDAFLQQDRESHVAVETLVTTGQVVVAGEVKSSAYVDIPAVVRKTIRDIGYTKPEYGFEADSCGILSAIHEQSQDIDRGTTSELGRKQGAGDQGLMFGFATDETDTYMPVAHYLATLIVKCLAEIRKEGKLMRYLRPDAKSQVTVEYDSHGLPQRIDTIVVSTQHDDFGSEKSMREQIVYDVVTILIPYVKAKIKDENVLRLFNDRIIYHINPTGKFVIGGPAGDTGLTGRKIIVDTYGGYACHGGGAFSGKSSDKVDRSAAYAVRYIAKNLVANGLCRQCEIQLGYAIGVAEPVSIYVNDFGTNSGEVEDLGEFVKERFDLSPWGIEQMLHLKNPIYLPTAAYGHFGREPYEQDGITFFPWEKV
ncbi:MAG: methionine adenosyltransferase, partial [Bacteroidaceae bacterium]|nr:methionine adenosyltransferase [Bacteroidaceae bacterium]